MWIVFAILASVFWGLTYVVNEQVYKHISIYSSLAITLVIAGIVTGIYAYFTGTLPKDLVTMTSSARVFTLVAVGTALLILAEIFIALSIVGKNATIAGLVEISYPLFIAVFAYLLFRESQLTAGAALGGALIFLGITVIYIFNR
ncbi:MAG TPA: EamA family transporter [Candidatus Paceibacterota bacterium]|nr:EamA family transporter [Candidatus Paceibacterota bacterium]